MSREKYHSVATLFFSREFRQKEKRVDGLPTPLDGNTIALRLRKDLTAKDAKGLNVQFHAVCGIIFAVSLFFSFGIGVCVRPILLFVARTLREIRSVTPRPLRASAQ